MGATLEQLQQAMDAYANFRHEIEGRKSEKQTKIDQALMSHPEIRSIILEIEESFDEDMSEIKGKEKQMRIVLDSMIAGYLRENPVGERDVISSKMLSVTAKAESSYDVGGLDDYLLHDATPEVRSALLKFRREQTKTVVRLKSF